MCDINALHKVKCRHFHSINNQCVLFLCLLSMQAHIKVFRVSYQKNDFFGPPLTPPPYHKICMVFWFKNLTMSKKIVAPSPLKRSNDPLEGVWKQKFDFNKINHAGSKLAKFAQQIAK